MMPNIHINTLAIIIAVVANFILGYLWYTPIFGRIWAKEMGFVTNEKPPASAFAKGIIFSIIGNFLMVWVFAHNMAVWNPVTWGLPPSEMSASSNAFVAAFFTWLGFFLPVDLSSVAWENKSWKLFFINTGHHFITLLIAAMIIAHMCLNS